MHEDRVWTYFEKKEHELKPYLIGIMLDDYNLVHTKLSGKKTTYTSEDVKDEINLFLEVKFQEI